MTYICVMQEKLHPLRTIINFNQPASNSYVCVLLSSISELLLVLTTCSEHGSLGCNEIV